MASTTRDKVAQNLLGAVDTLINGAMRSAEFDKTVVATILTCTDQVTGKYRVQYQDSRYYATTSSAEDVYKEKDEVYILVPQGDFNRPKKIIGKVSENSSSKTEAPLLKYDEVGESIVSTVSEDNEFSLSSYKWLDKPTLTHDAIYLYKYGAEDNLLTIADDVFLKTINDNSCKYFNIEGSFLTMIPASQRMGNYGLLVKMIYEDETGNEESTVFKLDIGQMTGDPYRYANYTVQKRMYDLPIGTYKRIDEIILFSDDFVYKIPDSTEVTALTQKQNEIDEISKQLASTTLSSTERKALEEQLENKMVEAQVLRDQLYAGGFITEEQLQSNLAKAIEDTYVSAQKSWGAAQESFNKYKEDVYNKYTAEEKETDEVKKEYKEQEDAYKEQEDIFKKAEAAWNEQKRIVQRGKYADIFCKNIRIVAMLEVENPYFSTYSIELNASAGWKLSDKTKSTTITPTLWLRGEAIGSNSDSAPTFYWFRQNSAVFGDNKFFCDYGGHTWECLNQFTWDEVKTNQSTEEVATNEKGEVEVKATAKEKVKIWTPQSAFTVARVDGQPHPKKIKYKCVAVLPNGNKFSKIFYVEDSSSDTHELLLESNKSTKFFDNRGTIDLVTYVKTGETKEEAGDKFTQMETYWHKTHPSGASTKLIKPYGENEDVEISDKITNYDIRTILLNLISEYSNANGEKTNIGLIQQGLNQECYAGENTFGTFTNEPEYAKTSSQYVNGSQKALYNAFAIIAKNSSGEYSDKFKNFVEVVNAELGFDATDETILEMSWNDVQKHLRTFRDKTRLTYLSNYVYHDLPSAFFSGYAIYGVTIVKSHYIEEPVLNEKGEQEKDSEGKPKTKTVLDKYEYLGSADIRLENTISTTNGADLIILGGDQIFKYDNSGNSPIKQTTNGQPQASLTPLTFSVMDANGKFLEDAKIFKGTGAEISEWTWKVPAEDTMLILDEKLVNDKDITKLVDENKYYEITGGIKELSFAIADQYNASYTRNQIQLIVKWGEKTLYGYTNFAFLKDGANGTNGTEYVCKILPNRNSQRGVGEWPALEVYSYASNATQLNYDYPLNVDGTDSGNWFEAELWKNNTLVAPQQGDAYDLEWSILTNQYVNQNNEVTDTAQFIKYERAIEGDTNSPYGFWADGAKAASANQYYNHPSNIVQAKITYKPSPKTTEADAADSGSTFSGNSITSTPQTIFGTMPMTTIIYHSDSAYRVRIKPDSGYNQVLCKSDGTDPEYPKDKEFEVEVFYLDPHTNQEVPIHNNKVTSIRPYTNNQAQGTGAPIKCDFSVYGHGQAFTVENWSEEVGTDGTPNNKCTLNFDKSYSGFETNNGLRCDIYVCTQKDANEKPTKWEQCIATIYFPIHVSLNRYGMSALNEWNGSSLTIGRDDDGNQTYLLAPQVGAGFKESDNSFTGMVMGTTRNTAEFDKSDRTGLFGYKAGQQTVFLDAETGRAEFGRSGAGQIIIDPVEYDDEGNIKKSSARIYGGNYEDEKSGLLIDLTKPEIKYGNGNFSVNPQGIMHAEGADITGTVVADKAVIGPWVFDEAAMAKMSKQDALEIATEWLGEDNVSSRDPVALEDLESTETSEIAGSADAGTGGDDNMEQDDSSDVSDGKHRTFATPYKDSAGNSYDVPQPPYSVGDLWYLPSGASITPISGVGATVNEGQIKVCIVSRGAGAYNANDWELQGTYVAEENLANLKTAYEAYATSAVSAQDEKTQKYLQGGGRTDVGDDYVISPYIGGGYLNIVDTTQGSHGKVIIDPANHGKTGFPFRVDDYNGNSVFAVNKSGHAYIGTKINDKGEYTGGWRVAGHLLHSLFNGTYTILQSGVNEYAIAAGATSPDNGHMATAPFYVKHDGTMKATSATIKGDITATNLTITNDATITGLTVEKLGVSGGGNLYATGYDTFEHITNDNLGYSIGGEIGGSGSFQIVDDTVTQPFYGTKCLRITCDKGAEWTGHLGNSENGYGSIPVQAGSTYLISMWVKTSVAGSKMQIWAVRKQGRTQTAAASGMQSYSRTINTANVWTRVYCEYTAESNYPYLGLRIDNDTTGSTLYIDAIQIEKASPGQQPAAFAPAAMTIIDGGHINTSTLDAKSGKIGGWSIQPTLLYSSDGSVYSGIQSTSTHKYSFFSGALGIDTSSIEDAAFKINKTGVVEILDKKTYEDNYISGADDAEEGASGESANDETSSGENEDTTVSTSGGATTSETDYGATSFKSSLRFTGISTAQAQLALAPNRIYFYYYGPSSDVKNNYRSAALRYVGAKDSASRYIGSGGNYLYCNKPFGMAAAQQLSGPPIVHETTNSTNAPVGSILPTNSTKRSSASKVKMPNGIVVSKGTWNTLSIGVVGRCGIPVVSQGFMFDSTWFGEKFTGYTTEFGQGRKYCQNHYTHVRNTILKGRNVFIMGYGNAPSSGQKGYINLLSKYLNSNASQIRLTSLPEKKSTTTDKYRYVLWDTADGKLYRGTNGVNSTQRIKDSISSQISESSLNPHNLYNANIYQFKYKKDYLEETDPRFDTPIAGFIVEDLIKHYPIAVNKDDQGLPTSWASEYLIPPMLKLIQEQKQEIDELKETIIKQQQQIDLILSKLG